MRVTPQMEILDTVYIGNEEGGQNIPAITFANENYIVAFLDMRPGKGIITKRISPQGIILDTGYTVDDGNNNPDIATDGTRSLVVWSKEFVGVLGRCVDSLAKPEDSVFTVGALLGSSTAPKVAYGGSNYLVVWSDFNSPVGDLDIFGQVVSTQGQLVDERITIARGAEIQKSPNLAFDGSRYIITWLEGISKICGQFVGTNGKLIGSAFQISDTTSIERQFPSIAAGSSNYLVAWAEYHNGFDIYGSAENLINVNEEKTTTRKNFPTVIICANSLSQFTRYDIFDIAGRRVRTNQVEPGIYFIKFGEYTLVKVIIIK